MCAYSAQGLLVHEVAPVTVLGQQSSGLGYHGCYSLLELWLLSHALPIGVGFSSIRMDDARGLGILIVLPCIAE